MIHIIGAGLAGLAAALDLTAAGHRVVVHEAAPACGGRCRSYFDRELGCQIDNGNHLLLSANHAAMRYLDMLGTRHTLGGPDEPIFPFIDLSTGERWCLRPNASRLPWWLLFPSRGIPGVKLGDYAGLLRLRTASAEDTVGGLLAHNTLYRRLIEPLAVSALNTPADEGSARLFWAIVEQSLARGGAQCIPHFPVEGLSESFIDPAIARITAEGGTVRTGSRITAVTAGLGVVTAIAGADGEIPIAPSDRVILAVPATVAASLLPGLDVPTAHEAILNLHYKLDARVPKADPATGTEAKRRPAAGRTAMEAVQQARFVGLVGGLAEWVFIKPNVVSVTISAANRLLDEPGEQLARAIWSEVTQALDLVAEMPPWRLIREKRATFAATPEQHKRRPPATNHLPNLLLAGDWTDTGLPATIEGAIRSGFAASQYVTREQAAA